MNRGDVVLIHIPFVGSQGGKVRPALIIQDDSLNGILQETIVAEITSNVSNVTRSHQVLVDISQTDGKGSGLISNSAVRCQRLHVVPKSDIRKKIGRMSPAFMLQVDVALKAALGIS